MDIYIARQPIFNRNMSLFGYELLHRRSNDNRYVGDDHSGATAALVCNSYLVLDFDKLTNGKRGFINFTQDLLEAEIPRMLPKEKVVVEILESVSATDFVIDVCKKLKSEGYIIALDDLVFNRDGLDYTPLIELADIIKIEFAKTDKQEQHKLLSKYKNKIKFLAEKVETREQFQEAVAFGYELFQGYFFCKPMMLRSKEIASLNIHLIQILKELQKSEPDFWKIAETFEKDMGITYKLLKKANTIFYGSSNEIGDLHQALIRLGIKEMKRWISILLIRGFEHDENRELIQVCLLRGKLLSLMAEELNQMELESDFFFMGVFSSIDIIMNQKMETIINDLAISENVKNALQGENGQLKECLETVMRYEKMEFDEVKIRLKAKGIAFERFEQIYIEALTWMRTVDG